MLLDFFAYKPLMDALYGKIARFTGDMRELVSNIACRETGSNKCRRIIEGIPLFSAPENAVEVTVFNKKKCKGDEGIWDTLGYYSPQNREIFLCEPLISGKAINVSKSLKIHVQPVYFVLRELVRLHEYIHYLQHRFLGETFMNIDPQLLEPLTELVSILAIEEYESQYSMKGTLPFRQVFGKIDQDTPSYYREWEQLKNSLPELEDKLIPRYVVVFISSALLMEDCVKGNKKPSIEECTGEINDYVDKTMELMNRIQGYTLLMLL